MDLGLEFYLPVLCQIKGDRYANDSSRCNDVVQIASYLKKRFQISRLRVLSIVKCNDDEIDHER